MAIEIQLSEAEAQLLTRLLEQAIGDIKSEIRHTMSSAYKLGLREQQALLVELHRRLTRRAA